MPYIFLFVPDEERVVAAAFVVGAAFRYVQEKESSKAAFVHNVFHLEQAPLGIAERRGKYAIS